MVSQAELKKQIAKLRAERIKTAKIALANKKKLAETEKLKAELRRLKKLKPIKQKVESERVKVFKKKAAIAAKTAGKGASRFLRALDKQLAKSKF